MKLKNIFLFISIALLFAAAVPAHAAGASMVYTYDALGRVTKVTYDNGTVIVYTYDAAGNRVNQTVTCSNTGC